MAGEKGQPAVNRACAECKRKKTKCDGRRPQCSLCARIFAECVYAQRKSRVPNFQRRNNSTSEGSLSTYASQRPYFPTARQASSPPDATSNLSMVESEVDNRMRHSVFDTSMVSNMGNNERYFQAPTSESSAQADHAHDTFQDMMNFLVDSIPDAWQPGVDTQLGVIPDPLLQSGCNMDFLSGATEPTGLEIAPEVENNGYNSSRLRPPPTTDKRFPAQSTRGDKAPADPDGRFTLDIPSEVGKELVDLYFKRIQMFLPLFHRPTFHQNYVLADGNGEFDKLTRENVFVLSGMFALAARFSNSTYFQDINIKERGNKFARKAQAIFHETNWRPASHCTSLKWLQGCILLAYYHQACRPPWQEDFPFLACIRLAHQLQLHVIDEDESEPHASSTTSEWVSKEERRRAWWAVWEHDAFDSVLNRHPFLLDRSRMHVLLPVSDELWFSGTPGDSGMILPDVLQCWKSLRDTSNKDPKAWFLISNHLLVHALELCQRRKVPQKSVRDLDNAVICFSHLLHEKFRGATKSYLLEEDNIFHSNWLIMARLMLYSTQMTICLLNQSERVFIPSSAFNAFATASPGSISVPKTRAANVEVYSQPANEAFRIFRAWPPDHIDYVAPVMVCCVVGPAAMNLRFARHLRKDATHTFSIEEDLLILILKHFASNWDIGSLLLNYVRSFGEE
ncbi:Fungal Zn2-Cys6 binuclear cluster domain-containing protein [Cladophialophora immunda]|nr:Fungal Zn2-Cys6 binuclear cluster domain-containing protein [Cladophialophora immunda]